MSVANKLISYVVSTIALALLFPLASFAGSNKFSPANICDIKCQQHIQSMFDAYRLQHQILAMQMSVGLSDNSIINFNSGTLIDPTVDPQTKNVETNSLLKINSITKTFTAAMIFQLESEGKLNTDDTVGKWFPYEYPEWKNITIDQLLHMTSGIYEYGVNENLWNEISKDWSRIWTSPELIDFGYYDKEHINPHPWCTDSFCPIQPGHGWAYNNTNYVLLTRIIELASHKSYQENLYKRIINNSSIGFNKKTILYAPDNAASNPEKIKNMIHIYYDSQDVTSFPISIERGAGGIISNTENLVKWLRALFNGKVLPSKLFNKMTSVVCQDDEGAGSCVSIDSQGGITKYQPSDPMPNDQLTNNGYSSGLSTVIYPNVTKGEFIWISNGGDPLGYQSQTVYFKDSKMIFALMENKKAEAGHELDIENFIFDIKNYLLQQGH